MLHRDVAAAIVSECARRPGYGQHETIAILTLAIDETWTHIPAGFLDQLDQLPHPTHDTWYNLAALRGHPPERWQEFKTRLYTHIDTAAALYKGAPMRTWPLKPGTYTVSSGFGPRAGGMHYGLDFAAKDGTPIYAAQGGTIQHIGAASGFGQWIVIDHPAADGGGTTVYGHMWDAFRTGLKQGQRVEAGQLIAYVGSNGQSSGPHLHFEVHPTVWRAGSQIDPWPWLNGSAKPEPPVGGPVGDPVWLPEVLRAEGLTVVEMPGWRDRGHGDFGEIWGIVAHHTGSNNASPESIAFHPTLGLASQIHLARNGVVTLCGAGVAWHAGNGSWPGLPTNGANQRTIGIEAANDGGGSASKPLVHRSSWPDVQYDAYVKVCAAILRKLGRGADRVICHKEWAGAAQGKWDPGQLDPTIFRRDIAARLSTAPGGIEDMAQVPQAEWNELLDLARQQAKYRRRSRSALRSLNDPEVDTIAGLSWTTDGSVHVGLVEKLAVEYGDPAQIALLIEVASAADDSAKYPHRQQDAKLAKRILAKVNQSDIQEAHAQIKAWLDAEARA